jgi:hypothetical protein
MSVAIRAEVEEIRRLPFGSIGAAYMGVGTAFEHPIRIIALKNATDVALSFSKGGVFDWIDLESSETIIIDMTSNKTIETGFVFDLGSRIYVREHPLVLVAPSIGYVSVSVIYGETGL